MKTTPFVKLIAVISIVVVTTPLRAQTLVPTQWYRISAPHVDIIFKGNIHREAQRIANTLEHLYEPVAQSLGVKPPKTALVLRNQQAISNGFVALAPRRMEFLTFPSQDYNFLGTNDWLNMLGVHEFRHVVQFSKLHQNFNQLLYWLGGDLLLGGIIGGKVPPWFLEGDAVGIETALTQNGRGRMPHFSLLYKTNLLERGGFHYYKQSLGSLKDPVPDHYKIGYYLTTHLRRQYGANILANIFERTTRLGLYLTAIEQATRTIRLGLFSIAMEQATGKDLLQVYEDTNQELKSLWQRQLEGLKLTQAIRVNPRDDPEYTDYTYPQLDQGTNLIVLKSGIGTVTQFILLNGQKKERPIFIPGPINQPAGFSVAQGQLVWVEQIPDPRWKDRFYSVIQRYDSQKKRLKTLTHKSRYGSAALSPDATKIVAAESDEGYNHQLVILDADTGQVLQRLPNPDNHFYLTPRWSADGKQIVVVKHAQRKATIALMDVFTEETQDLLPYSEEHIGCPVLHGQYVFYNSAYSGIDNIYALDLKTHQRYQVTSSKYGAYNPLISADAHWIIFNDFTKDGMDVVQMRFDPKQWTPLEAVEDRTVRYYAPLVTQEHNSDVLANIPNHKYPVEHYHPWKHWLNIHSWSPQALFDGAEQQLGLTIQSNDLLGTTDLSVGYLHDFKRRLGGSFAGLSYQGWYPIIGLSGSLIRNYKENKDTQALDLTLRLPLTIMRGQYTHQISLSTTGGLRSNKHANWFTQTYQGNFSRTAKKSLRDIYCPWGQALRVRYLHTPYGGDRHGQLLDVQTTFYFPGLIKHHAFRLSTTYRYAPDKEIYESCPNSVPIDIADAYTKDIRSVKAAYDLPIYYPDWSLGALLYVKRLRAHAFYNLVYMPQPPEGATKYTNTAGLGLIADIKPFSLPITLAIGVQYLYSMEKGKGTFLLLGPML